MKRLFTLFSLLILSSATFGQISQRNVALHPDGWKPKPAPTPFLYARTHVPMGMPLVSPPEQLSYYNPAIIDAQGNLDPTQFTTFHLPDTLANLTFQNPAGNGTYFRNELMERFTASDVNFFLDSVAIAFSVDTVPSKITCWVLQDTVDIQGRPFPNFNAKPLAVASILRSQMAGKDTFTFYTVPFKHKSINANSASPNSFYVSLSTLTSTVTTTGAPFFGVPATKNSIFVLTDNTTDNTGRSIDYTIDRMHWTATRTDGSYVSWNNIAHEFFLTSQTTATDTAWLYPNMFMIAYVSYNNSGVNTAPLTGNALGQNYPNAFNSSTEIKYSLENESKVSLKVYNTLGMEIGTLADDFETAGEHQVSFNGSNLPSGTYFYTLRAGDYSATKRMVIAK